MRLLTFLQRASPGLVPALVLLGSGLWMACGGHAPETELPGTLEITEVALRGHPEARVDDAGTLRYRLVDASAELELCLRAPAEVATSQWRVRPEIVGLAGIDREALPFLEPTARLGSVLCVPFGLPQSTPEREDGSADGTVEICGTVRDTFDGATATVPCQTLVLADDGGARRALDREMQGLLRAPPEGGLRGLVDALDALALRARSEGLPFLTLRIELVTVYSLRRDGSASALEEAARRLDRPPPWLDQPPAIGWNLQWHYERALVALARDWDLRSAWGHLALADSESQRVVHPIRLVVRMKQAEILARVGALGEATDRLASALDDCASMHCNPRIVPSARGVLAWFVALDPLATERELEDAHRAVTTALAGGLSDPLEEANQELNRAYLAWRRGHDPTPALAAARQALGSSGDDGAWARQLQGWSRLIEGLAALDPGAENVSQGGALENHRAEEALAACGSAVVAEFPRLAAWASDCSGRGHRLHGDLDAARVAFETARLFLDYATPERLGRALAIGPGQRAEIVFRAARLEVDRGEPSVAWRLLAELDRWVAGDDPLAGCRDLEPGDVARRDELLASLARLEGPASGRERQRRSSVQRELSERLEELVRSRPGCADALVPRPDQGLDRRAFTVDDEVLVLHRDGDGHVRLAQRTEWPRAERVARLEMISRALAERRLDDLEWRRLAEPWGRALAADLWDGSASETADAPRPTVVFALHGELQRLPLAALPAAGESWLADHRTPALWPSGLGEAPAAQQGGAPLFVVDPRGDLASGRELSKDYRARFPEAEILAGDGARKTPFRQALGRAEWLHVDAHGRFDPAFPELSSLLLADGPLTLAELAEQPVRLRFANLSGCRTGRWVVTADSGRFGFAGLLARQGAGWVVASRDDLADRLAVDYNLAFYDRLAQGESVEVAHGQALAVVRRDHPAVAWASLLLLRGPPGEAGALTVSSEGRSVGGKTLGVGLLDR